MIFVIMRAEFFSRYMYLEYLSITVLLWKFIVRVDFRVLYPWYYFTNSAKGENGKIIGLSEIFQKLGSQSEQ